MKRAGVSAGLVLAAALAGGCEPVDAGFGPRVDRPLAVDVLRAEDPLAAGNAMMANGEYEIALRSYRRALSVNGVTADVLLGLGSANARLGRLNQAEHILRQALDMDPSMVAGWNNLGVVLEERGKLPEAEQAFHMAVALDSGRSEMLRQNLETVRQARADELPPASIDGEYALVRLGQGRYFLDIPNEETGASEQ
ncbi:MAG: tetratricopeptide repeat protein [Rubricella sp.]